LSQRHPLVTPSLDAIRAPIAEDLKQVDEVIHRRLASDVVLIRTIAAYIVGSGGKRLRPALVLLSANAFGAQGPARHELAAVIEFIHTATLLHDDVVDESSLRRGRKTANAEFGNAASVLVGDFLYSRAFQMIVEAGSLRVMKVLADATNVIAEGEVLQLLNVHDPDTDEEKYLRVANYAMNMNREIDMIAHSCGVRHARELKREHVRIVQASGQSVALNMLYPYPELKARIKVA